MFNQLVQIGEELGGGVELQDYAVMYVVLCRLLPVVLVALKPPVYMTEE